MDAGGGETQYGVAGADGFAGQQVSPFDGAHGKSGEVEIAFGVEAGHLGRLAADQGAAGLAAAFGDPGDDLRAVGDVQFSGGVVIEKEKRLGALHDDVVDAHGDQIDADGVEHPSADRQFQLGADAVGAGHQNRVPETRRLEVEQAAEPAEIGVAAGAPGRARERLDGLHQGVPGVDIDARVLVAEAARTLALANAFLPG